MITRGILIFFRSLLASTGLNWRTIDKGLWVMGEESK